jgi:hypothetical protein
MHYKLKYEIRVIFRDCQTSREPGGRPFDLTRAKKGATSPPGEVKRFAEEKA